MFVRHDMAVTHSQLKSTELCMKDQVFTPQISLCGKFKDLKIDL